MLGAKGSDWDLGQGGRQRGWGEKGHGRVNVRPQHTNEMRGAGCVIQPKGFSRADYSF